MDYKPFYIKRLPRESENDNAGPDKPGDWFGVLANGNPNVSVPDPLPAPRFAYITAFGGSVGARNEAQKLCDMLNRAWEAFHNGDETALFPVPKKEE